MWLVIAIGLGIMILILSQRKSKKADPVVGPSSERIKIVTRQAGGGSAPDRPRAAAEVIVNRAPHSVSPSPRVSEAASGGPDPIVQRNAIAELARTSARSSAARWLPPHEPLVFAGLRIDGGMIYVGERLPTSNGAAENCLVNPELRVSSNEADRAGSTMSYWPSYSAIQPAARRAYLEWLAGGRVDPDIGLGYVFLFFYGLERRLFVDRAYAEAPVILAEVRRLQGLYGNSGSFASYSAKLLDAAALLDAAPPAPPQLRPDMRSGYELPYDVRRHLGARLAAREPFSADDALLWLLALPDTYLRTPAVRCFKEFLALWQARFAVRYANGLRVTPPKTRLKAEYRAASGTFNITLPVGDLPDIAAVSAPIAGLRDLAHACTEDLDAYSRLLGRRPEAAGTAEAACLLPTELLASESAASLRSASASLAQHVADGRLSPIPMQTLCEALGVKLEGAASDKLPPDTERQIASILDRVGVGFEPDRRYGPSGVTIGGKVVLFKAEDGGRIDSEQPRYATARTMVEIGALAAMADDQVVAAELDSIEADISSLPGISGAEVLRLRARTAALLCDPPRQQGAFTRLNRLGEAEKRRITQSAVSAVLADGQVTPSEVKYLERLHKALGLPPSSVYAALHRGSVDVDEPVAISVEQRSPGVPIPPEALKQPPKPKGVRIDEARLTRVRTETAAVSALLANIFVEESNAPEVAPSPGTLSRIPGLDAAHAELLSAVLTSGLDRATFDGRARDLRLLSDGAIETINEWAFDKFDEPILEDGELICAAEHLRPQVETILGGVQ